MGKNYNTPKQTDDVTIANLFRILSLASVAPPQWGAVVDFISIGANNDRRYRIENGGGVRFAPLEYSRRGATIALKRRAAYYATAIRKAIASARRIHPDAWTVALRVNNLRVNNDGDLVDPELHRIQRIATRGRKWSDIAIKPGAVVFRASASAIASTIEEGENGERN